MISHLPRATGLIEEAARTGNALKGFLANARAVETVDDRRNSAESDELGRTVSSLLAPAPISGAFKAFIVGRVREAYAWQTSVDDALAPDRLGLASGQGIFDPQQASGIEEQTLRRHVYEFMGRSPYTLQKGGVTLASSGSIRPRDVEADVDELIAWETDFRTH